MAVGAKQPDISDMPLPWLAAPWSTLAERLAEDRMPHALLFTGQPGIGKTLLARALAMLALCRSPRGGRACGSCNGCIQFAAGTHPDFTAVTVQEDKTVITVEQVRLLIAEMQLHSQHGGRKVALIEPADSMSLAAANSLLKTLEEPTPGTLLLLVSARPVRLPATLRSRCQILKIGTPEVQASLDWLLQRESRKDWPVLLHLAAGAPLAALALASSDIVSRREALFSALLELRSGGANPLRLAENSKEAYPELLHLLWTFVSDLILLRSGAASPPLINVDRQTLLQKAVEGLNLRGLYGYLDQVQAAIQIMETPVNRELAFAVLLSEWANGLETAKHAPLAARHAWGTT